MTAGLYVHVPFCLTRCGYCDFNAYAGLGHLAGGYARALAVEAERAGPEWAGERIVSIFFGGGTPTTLPSADLVGLLEGFRRAFDVDEGAEITVEANPDTVDESSLGELVAGGVSRLSMGAQSFDPGVLAALERVHGPDSVRRAFAGAREAGLANANLDLIFGADGETIDSWRGTLEETVALAPEHVSAYALTVEPATALGRAVATGATPPPDPDLQADMYALACDVLGAAGYRHYEVSNWALPGSECVHNLGYWRGRPYLGLGAGAHSARDGRRWWNVRPPQQYVQAVGSGASPVGGGEILSADDLRLERLLLGLRTAEGIPGSDVEAARAAPFVAEGLVDDRAGMLVPTERGLFLANELVLALVG